MQCFLYIYKSKFITMKKFFAILFIIISLNSFSQVIAPDFSEHDIYGTEYNLYNELDLGKPVVLDFFGTS